MLRWFGIQVASDKEAMMKGFLTGAGSVLLATFLLPSHPVLAGAVATLVTVIILVFWTGIVQLRPEK